MGKKILFIMLELDSASGICVQNVARELSARGYEIHILTKSPERDPRPYFTEYGALVHAVTAGWLDRIRFRFAKASNPPGKMLCRFATLAERAKVVLCYPTWPLKDFGFCHRLVKKAKKMMRHEAFDAVIPSYNTVDALIAANEVKKENTSISYIPYMLDAFYGGQTPRLMSEKRKKSKALVWETRLFSRADGIVMMKPARDCYLRDEIAPDYLSRTVFLDLPMLCKIHPQERSEREETVFLFAGSMPRNIRDPQHLLALFQSIGEPNWRLWFVGPSDFESVIDTAAASDPRIRRIGRVSHAEAQRYMADADYLVNIGNTLAYMVPSKIFEYMSFQKPIISTVKVPGDPCVPYLNLYGRALLLNEKDTVTDNAALLRAFVKETKADAATVPVGELIREGMPLHPNTPAAFADYIQQLLNGKA